MLRTRVLTALALLPLAWLLVFRADAQVFTLIIAALMAIGAWEYHRLAALKTVPWGIVLIGVQLALIYLAYQNWAELTADPIMLFSLGCIAWVVMLLQLYFYQPGQAPSSGYQLKGCLNALVSISFGWLAVSWLRLEPQGAWWITLLLLTIWSADIGAYFTGRAIGGSRLAPKISPGKTRAGLYGGLVTAAVVPVLVATQIPGISINPYSLAALCVVTALISVGGDLFISMHKRTVGLKDAGRLFPGHGGVLDRFDSLLAGAPFFVLGKLLTGM